MGKGQSKEKKVNNGALEQDASRKVEFGIVNIDSHSSNQSNNLNWMEIIEILSFVVLCLIILRYVQRYCLKRNRRQNIREAGRLASAIAASTIISIPTTAMTQTNIPVLQGAQGPTPAIDYSTWRE